MSAPQEQEQGETCLLEPFDLEHIPEGHQPYAALFRDVSNVDFLHAQLQARNPDFDYAFIDASSLMSRRQLMSAIWRAIMYSLSGSLTTATIHSEIVLCLSPKNNVGGIAQSPLAIPRRADLACRSQRPTGDGA
jgi:EKC/KEOPS complex subunit TPRKB/CGI121